jgi:hypothetical protein
MGLGGRLFIHSVHAVVGRAPGTMQLIGGRQAGQTFIYFLVFVDLVFQIIKCLTPNALYLVENTT